MSYKKALDFSTVQCIRFANKGQNPLFTYLQQNQDSMLGKIDYFLFSSSPKR